MCVDHRGQKPAAYFHGVFLESQVSSFLSSRVLVKSMRDLQAEHAKYDELLK